MHQVRLSREDDVDGWREAARGLAAAGVPGEKVLWQVGEASDDLFGGAATPLPSGGTLRVPKAFLGLANRALLHAEPQRWAMLYALLLRVSRQPGLLGDRADPALRRIMALEAQVRRDLHKMHAFLRFRELRDAEGPRFVAFYEPEHHIVRATAGFFTGRFTNMRWSILTPKGSLHWDGAVLTEGPAASRKDAPAGDPVEAIWGQYYKAIFNPARLMTRAMLSEMPKKYWKNMPETALIPEMIAGARGRELKMIERSLSAGVASPETPARTSDPPSPDTVAARRSGS
ncbi:TIGR03915 family putative DNA repair protein [Pararhodobacter sp. CCB-MM2]|uniref:TIGR03915 family putative DNA repair protein n=1 Tax=Pararhodobacter sp. CCB-MM2 TaxID=1786003 RepID=UPI00082D741D|nr:TIGR03915 family putative DNA repair protein [Pararhodobacter sp. CCB-MM2]